MGMVIKFSLLITFLLIAGNSANADESAEGAFLPPAPQIQFLTESELAALPNPNPSGGGGSRGEGSAYFGVDDLVDYNSDPEGNQSLAIDSKGRMFLAIEKDIAGERLITVYRSEGFNESWDPFFGTKVGDCMDPCLAVGEGVNDTLLMAFIYDDGSTPVPMVMTSSLDYPPSPHTYTIPVWNWEGYDKPVIWTDSPKYNAWYAFVTCEGIFDSSADNINVCAWRSTDYGLTWGNETVIFGNSDPEAWRDPDGCFGTSSNDDFIVCYNDTTNTIVEAISVDEGATWSSTVDVFTMSTEPDHAVDPEIAAAMDNPNVMICCTKYDVKFDSDCIGFTTSTDYGTHWTSLYKVPGASTIDEYAVALTANEKGGHWHIAFNRASNIMYTRRPQDLSALWLSPLAEVTDSGTASGSHPAKDVATHWDYDICGVVWTDFRGGSSDVDTYFDYSVNTQEVSVPTGFPTIQEAIDSVWHGTGIWIEPGTYTENIDFKGKEVHLLGREGPDYTVIDGTGSGSVITLIGLHEKVVIDSLTICYGSAAEGAGIYAQDSIPIVRNCVLHSNKASDGGAVMFDAAFGILSNCTIHSNVASQKGGAVYCKNDSSPWIKNSIIWDNLASSWPSIYVESGAPEVTYSDVEGSYTGTGNIDADPLFVDAANRDYHLLYASPCRDAGTTGSYVTMYDFEGDPREVDAAPDMGADEFHRHFYVKGALNPGGSIVGRLVGEPGTLPVYIWFGSGVVDPPLPTPYGDWYLMPPFIETGYMPAIPADGVMDLSTTLPLSYPAPYDVPMQAAVGQFTNLCTLRVR